MVHETSLIVTLKEHADRFPFQVAGEDGYPYGGCHTRKQAEDLASRVNKFTYAWSNPAGACVVKNMPRDF